MSKDMIQSVLTQKSQITLPKRVREFLGLLPGDQVKFKIEGDTVQILPAHSKLEENYGRVNPHSRPENFRQLREDFEEGVGREAREDS